MSHQEKVLCIKRADLPAPWVKKKSILKINESLFFETCEKAGFQFMERKIVEADPLFKQIIPYIILQTRDRKLTAAYLRNGSEERLHDLWSVGIGGHINPVDNPIMDNPRDNNGQALFRQIVFSGMMRELNEELIKRSDNEIPDFCGIINEEETPVGSVHLGAVFTLLTDTPELFIPGDELLSFTWKKTEDLSNLNLELWSSLALGLIA